MTPGCEADLQARASCAAAQPTAMVVDRGDDLNSFKGFKFKNYEELGCFLW